MMTAENWRELLQADRERFLLQCKRRASGRRDYALISDVVDVLITWSLANLAFVEFKSAAKKQAATVRFAKLGQDELMWETYPSGATVDAKLELVTRSAKYMKEDVRAWLSGQVQTEFELPVAHAADQVLMVPIAHLRTSRRQQGIRNILDMIAARGL